MKRPYNYGNLSLDEWSGAWCARPGALEVDEGIVHKRFQEASCDFSQRLSRLGMTEIADRCDLYFRGDFLGDLTHYLELVNPVKLTLSFVTTLQSWLQEREYREHRILIVSYVSDGGTLVIYPDVVRWGIGFAESVDAAIRKISRIVRRGVGFSTYTLVVDWPSYVGSRTKRSFLREFPAILKVLSWSELYQPGDWLSCWGPSVAAREMYIRLRNRLDSPQRDLMDRFMKSIAGSDTEFKDIGKRRVTLELNPETVHQLGQYHRMLKMDHIEHAYREIRDANADNYMETYEEFGEFIQVWSKLLNKAVSCEKGIICCAS